jgi:hypothetical protein
VVGYLRLILPLTRRAHIICRFRRQELLTLKNGTGLVRAKREKSVRGLVPYKNRIFWG